MPKTKTKRQYYLLQGLPNVGPKRAQLLLSHFGSVQAVFNASVQELQQVAGIGTKTAQLFYELVH